MIERKFVKERLKEYQIKEYVSSTLRNVGHSDTRLQRTPLGEKIIVSASRPGLVVGRKGENIKKLTNTLKNKFSLENPQIEIEEVVNPNLDAQIIAERIASTIERFGIQKFKGVGHKTMQDVMTAGALGVEILMSGKIPSQRARSWRFYKGYLKKSGDVTNDVLHAVTHANLKTGSIGIKVSIMPPDLKLPDNVKVKSEETIIIEEKTKETKKEETEKIPKKRKKKEVKKSGKKEIKRTVKKEIKNKVKKEEIKKTEEKTEKKKDEIKKETKDEMKKEIKNETKDETKKETKEDIIEK